MVLFHADEARAFKPVQDRRNMRPGGADDAGQFCMGDMKPSVFIAGDPVIIQCTQSGSQTAVHFFSGNISELIGLAFDLIGQVVHHKEGKLAVFSDQLPHALSRDQKSRNRA